MTTILVILAVTLAVGVLAMFWEMRKQLKHLKEPVKDANQEVLMEWLKEMRESQQKSTEILQGQMHRTTESMNQRLDNAAKVVQSVSTEVGKMSEIGQSMKELQQVLKSPKLRGNIGEQIMKDLLEQMLPKGSFTLQYGFKSGEKVDAVVRTRNGLIPIDAKFPLENYLAAQKAKEEADRSAALKVFEKDVKKHIDSIAKKYILPGEDTVDFAIMYVPGEAVYYEIMTATDLANHGAGKKVYLVSPNTFHYFLKTILVALEGEKIEERAKEVLTSLRAIKGDTSKLGDELGVLNRHVSNAKNTMDSVNVSFNRLGNRVENTGRLQDQQVGDLEGLTDAAEDPNQPKLHEVPK